jgi:cholesterol transport system auxiliary component
MILLQRLGALVLVLILPLVAGCSAISSLDSSARALDTFEMLPLAPAEGGGSPSGRTLFVATPTTTAAMATDRIMVKPNALQVTYLSASRWVDDLPLHVQSLLVRSLAATGRIGFVTAGSAGPLPDYVLQTDIETFQAEVVPAERGGALQVVVRLNLTLSRDSDGRTLARRSFAASAIAANDDPLTVVSAFNSVMTRILGETASWTVAVIGGRPAT